MIFVESPQFTRAITQLMGDDEYRLLQAALLENPEAGAVIVGSGGLRKIRWSLPGRGTDDLLLLGSQKPDLPAVRIFKEREGRPDARADKDTCGADARRGA